MAASMITCFAMATHRRPAPRRPRESSSPPCYLSTFEPEPPPTAAPPTLRAKRIYAAAEPADGYRVLVDRLWPRGVDKAAAALDEWAREITPSDRLRRWFHADRTRWPQFARRYRAELATHAAAVAALRARARERPLTLLSAARDLERSHVAVLRRVLASPQAPCSGGTRTQAIPAAAAAASPSGLSSKTKHSPGGTRKRRAASRKGSG